MAETSGRTETFISVDALSKAIDILAPQLASDALDLSNLKINYMRFTRLSKGEMLNVLYFHDKNEETGKHKDWYSRKMEEWMNLRMSEEGHERSVLIVKALSALGSPKTSRQPKKDKRGMLARNLWARNQSPDDEE